jgi:hypothetical protein
MLMIDDPSGPVLVFTKKIESPLLFLFYGWFDSSDEMTWLVPNPAMTAHGSLDPINKKCSKS